MPPFVLHARLLRRILRVHREGDGPQRAFVFDVLQRIDDGFRFGGAGVVDGRHHHPQRVVGFHRIGGRRRLAGLGRVLLREGLGLLGPQHLRQANLAIEAVVAIRHVLPVGLAVGSHLVADHRHILRTNAGLGRLLLEVVGSLAREQHQNQLGVGGLDALDDGGEVLSAGVGRERHSLDALLRQLLRGLLRRRNAVIRVLRHDHHLLHPQRGDEVGVELRHLRRQRRHAEHLRILRGRDLVVPRLRKHDGYAVVVGHFHLGQTNRAMVLAHHRNHLVLVDELLHHGRAAFGQSFGVLHDQFQGPTQHAAGRVDLLGRNLEGRLHGLAAGHRPGRAQGHHRADLHRLGLGRRFSGGRRFGRGRRFGGSRRFSGRGRLRGLPDDLLLASTCGQRQHSQQQERQNDNASVFS